MGIFDAVRKTDTELQNELKALCAVIVARQYGWSGDWERYEKLLVEIYKRDLTPEMTLKPIK